MTDSTPHSGFSEARIALGMLAASAGVLSRDHPVAVLSDFVDGIEEQYEVVRQNCLDAEANYLEQFNARKDLQEQLEAAREERAPANRPTFPLGSSGRSDISDSVDDPASRPAP